MIEMMKEEYLEVGNIVNTHGVKGELKVISQTDYPERFEELKQVYVEIKGSLKLFDIKGVRYIKGMVLLKLGGIDDMNAAEALKGCSVKINRKDARKLPEGSFLICDLIGLKVSTVSGELLGTVQDVLQLGSNDVYVTRNASGREILIPALKSVVKNVDIQGGTMQVELPKGLVDDEV